jgi:hypothetical protein
MMSPTKIIDESGIRRTAEKTPEFDPRKEKQIFEGQEENLEEIRFLH